jgi:hypothetical protein
MGSPANRPLGMGRFASLARFSGIAGAFFLGARVFFTARTGIRLRWGRSCHCHVCAL